MVHEVAYLLQAAAAGCLVCPSRQDSVDSVLYLLGAVGDKYGAVLVAGVHLTTVTLQVIHPLV